MPTPNLMGTRLEWKVVEGSPELHIGRRRYARVTQNAAGDHELRLLGSEAGGESSTFESLLDAMRQAEEWADLERHPDGKDRDLRRN